MFILCVIMNYKLFLFGRLLCAMAFVTNGVAMPDSIDAPSAILKPFLRVEFSIVNTSVESLDSLMKLFLKLRDDRFLVWGKQPGFKRRIPWLSAKQDGPQNPLFQKLKHF